MREKRQVSFYDSLDINMVNDAMEERFDRIQHMLFTRTHHPPKSKGRPAEAEEDECK